MDSTTWHDQRPTHNPIPRFVIVAQEKARVARQVYDDYIEWALHNGEPDIDWTQAATLANIANDADRELEDARELALNPECTCKPDSVEACPACKGRYGDTIPFEGAGI